MQLAVELMTALVMAMLKDKFKKLMSNSRRNRKNNMQSLTSALTAFDMHTLSPGTLSPTFLAVPSSPLLVSALVALSVPQTTLTPTSSLCCFTPTVSPILFFHLPT